MFVIQTLFKLIVCFFSFVCLAAEGRHFPDESSLKSDEMETSNAVEDGMEICIRDQDQDLPSLQRSESIRCAASSYTGYPSEHMESLNDAPPVTEDCSEGSDQDEPTREQITKDAIVHAIFHSLDCIDKMGGSLNNFADLLTMARVLYCKLICIDQMSNE